jgi:hypothetical protein
MAISDLQRRIAEVGRIRIGQQVKSGKTTRPSKLDFFRLTSPNRQRIEQAARLYGGDVKEWEAPAGAQWEVITKTAVLPVIVPPSDMAFSQWYELWSGGGCLRRCDGAVDSIGDQPCVCNPESRQCDIHTRLSVMLRDMPGLGLWRIDTSGYYAALELQGAVDVMRMAAAAGTMLPAQLRLEQRMIKRAGEQTKRFAVPVLDVEISPAQLLSGGDRRDIGTLAIDAPMPTAAELAEHVPPGNLTPVPASVQERPSPPVAEQATATKERKPRKNAATKIAPTGLKPRTAAEAAQKMPPPPDDDIGDVSEYVNQPIEEQQTPEHPHAPTDNAERAKLNRQMHALFRKVGIEKDRRDDRLNICAYMAKRYDITSANDLDDQTLDKVVQTLAQWDRDKVLDDRINDLLNDIAVDKHAQGQ